MTRVLLTGGNGFLASHILIQLLQRGHLVVTTVRSPAKAEQIKQVHADTPSERLQVAIVPDIGKTGAFEEVVASDPPIEAVIHTASPCNFSCKNPKNELFPPAIDGTVGLLREVKKSSPKVKTVIMTGSFSSVVNNWTGGHTFTPDDWSPVTEEEAERNPIKGYVASKTFAEKAAWKFMQMENPTFALTVFTPPYMFGPGVHLTSLAALNLSNEPIGNFYMGANKDLCPPSSVNPFFIDVRDAALVHILAMEKPDVVGGKRIIPVAGTFSMRQIGEIISKHFPGARARLPVDLSLGDALPAEKRNMVDDTLVKELLLTYRSLENSVVDLIDSFRTEKFKGYMYSGRA